MAYYYCVTCSNLLDLVYLISNVQYLSWPQEDYEIAHLDRKLTVGNFGTSLEGKGFEEFFVIVRMNNKYLLKHLLNEYVFRP